MREELIWTGDFGVCCASPLSSLLSAAAQCAAHVIAHVALGSPGR